MPRQTITPQRKAAELLAVEALAHIGADDQKLARFLALTGLEAHTLRSAARDSRFLAAVLDYVASDEALLVAFAAESGRIPSDVVRAAAALRGPDWERDTA